VSLGSMTILGNLRPEMTEAEKAWFEKELKEQANRYQKIVQEMEALADEREKWVAGFLERIQDRGFHVHAAIRRKIPKDEIRPRDGRPLQVVY